MTPMRFLDFDVLFQRTSTGFRAQVLNSPSGQASVEFEFPLNNEVIDDFLLLFGRRPQVMRGPGNSRIEEARAFGRQLCEAAFAGEIQSCLRSSLDKANNRNVGLRILLRLTETPELNDLPWELLLNPELKDFLALSAETPIVRYLALPLEDEPLPVKAPLRVLTVISSPTDFPPLDVENEWRKMQDALKDVQARGLLTLERLVNPTLHDLQRWLRRNECHILHFIGHGGFDSVSGEGLLLFTEDRRSKQVPSQTLGTLLNDHRSLRLAVLNACEGARTSRTDPFAGVAQSLVRRGIPAVIAMQFKISDRAAITFAHEFYAAVADGFPIDAALAEARRALFFAGHELEWGTPVLYMRSSDSQVFDIKPVAVLAEPTIPPAPPVVPVPERSRSTAILLLAVLGIFLGGIVAVAIYQGREGQDENGKPSSTPISSVAPVPKPVAPNSTSGSSTSITSEPEKTVEDPSPESTFWKFPAGAPKEIPVCWEPTEEDFSLERFWVQEAIEHSWERFSPVEFTEWDVCGAIERSIRIGVADVAPRSLAMGEQLRGLKNGILLNFYFDRELSLCKMKRETCIRGTAVHEFGHVLGFPHDPRDCKGSSSNPLPSFFPRELAEFPCDPQSVMNYRNIILGNQGVLTALDQQKLVRIYGENKGDG